MAKTAPLTLIGYQRVSTDDQKLELQHDALIGAGVEPDRIYQDKLSGAKSDRPGLEHALRACRKGDILVVWRLDRLGRSLKDLIATVDRLEERGVGLRSLQESIDTTTASGLLFFHIMGALAEFERNLIRERTMAGLQAARRRGKTPGRKPKLTKKDLSAARAMLREDDLTVEEVAQRVGVSPATLYRHLPGGRSAGGHTYRPRADLSSEDAQAMTERLPTTRRRTTDRARSLGTYTLPSAPTCLAMGSSALSLSHSSMVTRRVPRSALRRLRRCLPGRADRASAPRLHVGVLGRMATAHRRRRDIHVAQVLVLARRFGLRRTVLEGQMEAEVGIEPAYTALQAAA